MKEYGYINPKHVPSGENIADGLTKALDEEKFKHFVELLGLGVNTTCPLFCQACASWGA